MDWVYRPVFFQGFIYTSKQRVAEGDVIKWHTLRVQMHLFSDWSSDYVYIYLYIFVSRIDDKNII